MKKLKCKVGNIVQVGVATVDEHHCVELEDDVADNLLKTRGDEFEEVHAEPSRTLPHVVQVPEKLEE